MSCVHAIKERIDRASNPSGDCKSNLFERGGVALYAPLRRVIQLYEERDSALAKLVLAIAAIALMPLFVIGTVFYKVGSCYDSGCTSHSANPPETSFEVRLKKVKETLARQEEKIDVLMKQN